ncbi:hypothetical protein [Phenylobacterium sp.]|uniref:hypothetical protein n=1 Tax=Phenylobacterium sp. TaxID=1871053 RepID=UPI003D296A32
MKLQKIVALAAAWSLAVGTAALPGAAVAATVKIPEGTEFTVRLEESISSKHAQDGDRFTISLDDDVKLADGTVLRAGYRGVGEVVDARKSGMLGKTGKLAIRLVYLKVGEERIKLRAQRGSQGSHNTGVQVASLLLLWPALPFIKGKNTSIPKGTMMTAFADVDTMFEAPLPPPPNEM